MRSAALVRVAPLLLGVFLAPVLRAGSFSGWVLDPSGSPVAAARVQWFAYRDDDELLLEQSRGEQRAPLGETATDAEGRFRVALPKPGLSLALTILATGLPSARFSGPFESTEDAALPDIQLPPAVPASGRVIDESGRPVAGARVLAVSGEADFENGAEFLSETHTLADGSFTMPEAPGGARSIIVSSPGFARVSRFQLDPRGNESFVLPRGGTIRGFVLDPNGKPVAGALVTAGEAAAQTDAAGRYEITGIPPGSQSIRTTWKEDLAARADGVSVRKSQEVEVSLKLAPAAAASGSVVDEKTKKPLAGVRISLFAAGRTFFGPRRAERAARTDLRGRFRAGGLASQPYALEASKDGYLPASIPNVAVSLKKAAAVNLALRRAASAAGRVVDEKGQPVAGARVSINEAVNFRVLRMRGLQSAAGSLLGRGTLTGPDGSFRLRNITPARDAELEASKSDFATARQPGIALKPGDAIQGLSLLLRKGLQARGRVIDSRGTPVSGAELRVAPRESGGRGMRVQMRLLGMAQEKPDAVSRADGNYTIGGLSSGQYTAAVTRDGFARKSVTSLEVKATGENLWPPIVLAPGVALAGLVQSSSGQAIPGAQILAVDPGGDGRPLAASSGADGRFLLDALASDRPLMLNVSATGYGSVQREVTPPVQNLAITLKSSGTIRGRVEDADAQTPVADFTVETRASGGGRFGIPFGGTGGEHAFHSDAGVFELTDVAPGKWTVRASAEGYRPADVAGVEVAEGATKEGVVLSLKRGGSLSGRALDPQLGTGVPNASVSYQTPGMGGGGGGGFARLAGAASNNTTTTDADGHFSFDGTPDDKIMVTASHPDYLEVTQEVDASKQSSVDLTLGTGGSISGTVVGQDGATGIPGAQISLNPEGDTQSRFGNQSSHADGSGNFLFEHLRAGRFQLVAQSSDGKTMSQEVALAQGQRLTGVLLQTTTGALLQGTVSGLPAARLGGVRVTANGQNYSDNTTTDDSGKFTLRNVPSGVVRLNASTSFLSGRSTSTTVEIPDGATQFAADIVFQGASRLSGRITRGESPLSGIFVNANPVGGVTGAGRSSAQTDENGQYALEGLSDGDYTLSLSGQGVSYRRIFTISGDTPGDVALPPIQLSGSVTETGSGEPLDGATVQIQLQTPAGQTGPSGFALKMASGDSAGHYFIEDVDPGTYQVTARRDGYQAKAQTLTVGGDPPSLDFALQRGEGISVRVLDGLTGAPLTGVVVAAVDAGGNLAYRGSLTLDSTGKGEIDSLAPARYAVHFLSDGYASRTAIIDAPSPLVPVTLTPGGSVEVLTAVALTGRIVDSSGLPYSVSAFRTDGRITGSPPILSWNHVAPGSYQLLVGVPGAEVAYPFTVVEGQTTQVVVK